MQQPLPRFIRTSCRFRQSTPLAARQNHLHSGGSAVDVWHLVASSVGQKAIIEAMLRAFPPPLDCYVYGPVCVAESERGKGLAAALFKELQTYMNGRPAMTFIRADNGPSLRAHRKMGMSELGTFISEG